MEKSRQNRKEFIKTVSLVGFGSVLLSDVVFGKNLIALAEGEDLKSLGKIDGLTVLNDRPWNIETPAHLLDDKITPSNKFFVRNNGNPPTNVDVNSWTLKIEGESVERAVTLTLAELKSKFEHHTYQLTVECGGNGRHEFDPPAKGNQWTVGAVGSPQWTGVRLKDVLNYAGIKSNAVYIGYYGKDTHLSGKAGEVVISRGVPMYKALEDESLIAWAMNGKDLPAMNGYPLRLVFGGWPASTSGKWLERIVIRDKIHDGHKMEGQSYRMPCEPIEPGAEVKDEDMCIIESMPVKSVITFPKSGAMLKDKKNLSLRGHAWAGDLKVNRMDVSFDFGSTWKKCTLEAPANRLAWQHWQCDIEFPQKGYYEVWARATDENGKMQPMLVPGWNPKGYLNNACHRIAVKVM
jgi:DMSO/TMAO reductase YedYZ molybdopterin-dependent catalytic subunit